MIAIGTRSRIQAFPQPWLLALNKSAAVAIRTGSIHKCLTPVPYVGNIHSASIYLAMINPTVGWEDYEDDGKPEFQMAIRQNLLQEARQTFAIPCGKPQNSWDCYYRSVFGRSVRCAAAEAEVKEEVVWDTLRSELAILELVPYYSQHSGELLRRNLHRDLPSAQVALRAMKEIAEQTDALIICR